MFHCMPVYTCCSVLQRVAVCCSVLQCVAACCSACLHTHVAAYCSVFQCVSVHASIHMLQRVAACCSVLQCVALCCSASRCVAACCSVAVCCSMVQCHCLFTYEYAHKFIHPKKKRSKESEVDCELGIWFSVERVRFGV